MTTTAPHFAGKTEEKEYYAGKLEVVEFKIESIEKDVEQMKKTRAIRDFQRFEQEDFDDAVKKRNELQEKEKRYGKILESLYVDPISRHNHSTYKEAKGITDARTFLNAVAYDLYQEFQFSLTYENSPTFGDVLRVYNNGHKKQPNVDIKGLKARYEEHEWQFMKDVNKLVVNPFLHKPSFALDHKSRKVLVFPHEWCKKSWIKDIAVKSKIVEKDEDLIIRDSEDTSTSSNKSSSP